MRPVEAVGGFHAAADGTLRYLGNRLFKPRTVSIRRGRPQTSPRHLIDKLSKERAWPSLAKIDHQMFQSFNQSFVRAGAVYALVPQTTRMISSPGAIYRHGLPASDSVPFRLDWFGPRSKIYLSESSQLYLEAYLSQPNIDSVYAIYNSFRMEREDYSHLPEFHHVEYEGHINQEANLHLIWKVTKDCVESLLSERYRDLRVFLSQDDISELDSLFSSKSLKRIAVAEALKMLKDDTGDPRFDLFSTGCIGPWEETRLTELAGGFVALSGFPIRDAAFYQAEIKGAAPRTADNSDVIWPGYREYVGSGHRVETAREFLLKAREFGLRLEDYQLYLQLRRHKGYRPSSGFGLGWERLVQGLLRLPAIAYADHFPRSDREVGP